MDEEDDEEELLVVVVDVVGILFWRLRLRLR